MSERDFAVLEKIVEFCDRIARYIYRNDACKELFMSDTMFQDACLMGVIQIGELVMVLSDDVKRRCSGIPWRTIKDTRNFYVHKYGTIDMEMVWETINKNIPELKLGCVELLKTEENLRS